MAIAPDGVFAYSKFKNNTPNGDAELHAELKLINAQDFPVEAKVTYTFKDAEEQTVRELGDVVKLDARSQKEISTDASGLHLALAKYKLWSPEDPNLYKLLTTVLVEGKMVDRQETEFGIHTFSFDKDKGYLLNGQPYVLKGTCNHQDMAGVAELF